MRAIAACLADRQESEFFLVDANGGLTPETALRMLNLLPDRADIVLEAPARPGGRRCPCGSGALPIILDELAQSDGDIAQIIAGDVADGIGLKISKWAG